MHRKDEKRTEYRVQRDNEYRFSGTVTVLLLTVAVTAMLFGFILTGGLLAGITGACYAAYRSILDDYEFYVAFKNWRARRRSRK